VNNRGVVLAELGRFAEAAEAYERAIALAPRGAGIYQNLVQLKRFTDDDPDLAAMEKLAMTRQL